MAGEVTGTGRETTPNVLLDGCDVPIKLTYKLFGLCSQMTAAVNLSQL